MVYKSSWFTFTNPLKSAEYFALLFDRTLTYNELKSGTPKLATYIELISALSGPNSFLVRLEGIEPPTTRLERERSIRWATGALHYVQCKPGAP